MLLRIILFTTLWIFIGLGMPGLYAQSDTISTDSLPSDSLIVTSGPINHAWPVPKKALLYGIIPGGGQVYNRRWWKLPLVYGAIGGMVVLVDRNQTNYRRLKTALDLKRADQPHEFSGTRLDDVTTLRNLRDRYDKNTQLSYVGLTVIYLLQGIEAFVDAHLRHFDINDDLSIRVVPVMETVPDLAGASPGMSLYLTF